MIGKIQLTDAEWISLIKRDGLGLPPCCSNISILRDWIIIAATNGGEVDSFDAEAILDVYRDCEQGHDMTQLTALNSLITQVKTFLEAQ